jgi:hypothetical protein
MMKTKSRSFVLKDVKNLGLFTMFSQIILLSGCFLFPNYEDYVNSTIKPRRIRGIVIGKGKEEAGCFGLIVFKQGFDVDTLHKIYYCASQENDVWRYIEPGDSLLKEEGTLEVFVKRNGSRKRFVFATRTPL